MNKGSIGNGESGRGTGDASRLRAMVSSIRPGIVVAVLVTLAALMLTSALLEYRSSRRDLEALMRRQAHTLLESMLISSTNALRANDQLEAEIRQRLLDNASAIRDLYDAGRASNSVLAEWAAAHDLHRVRIEMPDGRWKYASYERVPEHDTLTTPRPDLSPIFRGETDTLVIGLRQARFENGFRYGVALGARDRSAIVVNLDADYLIAFRQQVGFGPLLRNMAMNPGIVYIAVQDEDGFLAAAGDADSLDSFSADSFLADAAADSLIVPHDRFLKVGGTDVFEVVHPFFYRGSPVGLLRLGMSLQPLDALNARLIRRSAMMGLALLAIGFVLLVLIVARQNANLLERQNVALETYSGQIIEHVGDGIIVVDNGGIVTTANEAALSLVGLTRETVVDRPIEDVLAGDACANFLSGSAFRDQVECDLPSGHRNLLIARSRFDDEHGATNTVLILRDLTRLLELEAQVRQRERMEALGTMASGLAHEIRNPLNAIGTVVQQLRTDFTPIADGDDYKELTTLVYSEVRRINEAIEGFLRMARPAPSRPQPFVLADLLDSVRREYEPMLLERTIKLTIDSDFGGEVSWDQQQIRQVLMNLIQNSVDAMTDAKLEGGSIRISTSALEFDEIEIDVTDSGPGIPETIQRRIFDLYFTTKAQGTGIGLSLVHRIVQEHGGTISVESAAGSGTTFRIRLPRYVR
ncbi:MAG: ATP-binding protein [Rhodothermales bacterium]